MARFYLRRYVEGQCEEVWEELLMRGSDIREKGLGEEAHAVAVETMLRVRENLQLIHQRLVGLGYDFASGEHSLRPLDEEELLALEELERVLGPLPLSLRIFYEVVGTVDFCQSTRQLIRYWDKEEGAPLDLGSLGDQDPLVVMPPDVLLEDCVGFRDALDSGRIESPERGLVTVMFAPDEFHKADYSGGENYGVALPCPEIDFFITGMYGIEETFVRHLRETIAHGGFRGMMDDDNRPAKNHPAGELIEFLSRGVKKF
jgi:hypothetical protein